MKHESVASDIVNALVSEGQRILDQRRSLVPFTQVLEADRLLNDLAHYPHAFVIACIMDRQVRAERAWLIPYRLKQMLGNFRFSTLQKLTLSQIRGLMTHPEPLHRFVEEMSKNLYACISLIAERYQGDASAIWRDSPSSALVIYRFLEFRGVGPKIATMATNILARHLKIPFSDYYSIDVSADVHIRRVFSRLELTNEGDTTEAVIYRARALHPEFPGLLDLPAWEIGREWCKPSNPRCSNCRLCSLCPSSGA